MHIEITSKYRAFEGIVKGGGSNYKHFGPFTSSTACSKAS